MNNNSEDKKFSLKDKIQKRKTQEIERSILDQQIAKARGDSVPTPVPPAQPLQEPPAKRITQEALPDKRATQVAAPMRVNKPYNKVATIVGVSAILIIFI